MRRRFRGKIAACLMAAALALQPAAVCAETQEGEETALIEAPSGLLMEPETGTVIYEKDADTKRSPASITKIMTLILIFDALEKGSLKLEDTVTTSGHAKSMGGSQVFLEEGETQSVETMIKCIVVASGNDASVAMAEHLGGSEEEFVRMMNERARGLGMENTNFEDCCGLTDSQNHYSTARDVAIMSRELITKYPEVLEYSSIWMEDITHVTRQGSSTFTLTNTNKLLRSYEGCVGLKTGSTSLAKFCLSAVAERDGISLISVVMAAPDYKVRLKDAAAMLNYGFARCSLYVDRDREPLPDIPVSHGTEKSVELEYESEFKYLDTQGNTVVDVKKELKLPEEVQAPVKKGQKAGEMVYSMGEKVLGSVPVLYKSDVAKAGYPDCLMEAFHRWLRVSV